MKLKTINILAIVTALFISAGCEDDVEKIEVQRLKTYDEQYYENLRAYKKSDHEISYAYYEAWAPIEGVTGYKDPASWGERIIGLPDSIDIVNLWMGIPTEETHPVAYKDMKYAQEKLGTRFVMHADASNYRHKFTVDGVEYNMAETGLTDEVLVAYAKNIVNQVNSAGLDGVDVDFEGWSRTDLTRLTIELANYMGPQSPHPEKLLIIDYFSSAPSSDTAPYCDYFVKQAYSHQGAGVGAGSLPDEKVIYCESFGEQWAKGGRLLDYARWEPASGHKGGCGVFFLGRNYRSASGIPYNEFRQSIQIMNPAVR